jgi:hypothetical protein
MIAELIAIVAAVSTPDGPADFAAWQTTLDRMCPSNHIEDWMPERNKADLIDGFLSTLPRRKATRVRRMSESWRCANAEGSSANSCEVLTDLHGLRKASLLGPFSRYACVRVRCTEMALCDAPRKN